MPKIKIKITMGMAVDINAGIIVTSLEKFILRTLLRRINFAVFAVGKNVSFYKFHLATNSIAQSSASRISERPDTCLTVYEPKASAINADMS